MKIDVTFSELNDAFKVDFGEVAEVTKYVGGELYEGEYEVIPRFSEQTLPTTDKVLTEDVTVREIPYFETSNESGGTTVYIGIEV